MECECCENCSLKRPTHHRPDHRTTENQATKLGDEAQRLENCRYRRDRPTELDVEESIVITKLQKRKEKKEFDSMYLVGRYGPVRTGSCTYSLDDRLTSR